ncbi:Rhodanese-like protein [Thioalkalivibrio nitratireducens DSM 14787]|uniref:Rhodanese-like protein n=1 Tax=Thioalkalivibrio nitratireducens (strain DSM 14787 / UNIQEM 213 / ALEN2) TaxID=1255043 RepID=L0DWB9_THIND|nr:rhodanese-like domain-containing protein [Thioalkalivibrio nitratireducens]AGA32661.1 Rhodanese-like protein [Thioalkalivibrio nitratireducens DSM 14787]
MKTKLTITLLGLLILPAAIWLVIALLPDPPYERLNNAALEQKVRDGAMIIDIRRPDEWRETGVIEGSYLVTAFDERGHLTREFPALFGQLTDPQQPVVLICRTGNRTDALARLLMEQAGYQQVYNVSRGITSWIAAGGEVKPCSVRGTDLRC